MPWLAHTDWLWLGSFLPGFNNSQDTFPAVDGRQSSWRTAAPWEKKVHIPNGVDGRALAPGRFATPPRP